MRQIGFGDMVVGNRSGAWRALGGRLGAYRAPDGRRRGRSAGAHLWRGAPLAEGLASVAPRWRPFARGLPRCRLRTLSSPTACPESPHDQSRTFAHRHPRRRDAGPQGRARCRRSDPRREIAKRLGLVALDRFVVEAEVFAVAGGIATRGSITADVVQACAATDLPVPAHRRPFDLRFLRDIGADASEDEEVEISADDCDVLPLEGDRVDIGEAAVQTLSLALELFRGIPMPTASSPKRAC